MKKENNHKILLHVCGREIAIYPCLSPGSPLFYLNTFDEEGERVDQALRGMECPDFTLVAISGLDWHHDMTPWAMSPVSEGAPPCTGGADEYLRFLTEEIMPRVEEKVQKPVLWRGLAGYSLAGLFAMYAASRSTYFFRIASISGSLWFTGFEEYLSARGLAGNITHAYLSLGDRECRTGNPYMKTVQDRTEKIAALFSRSGIDTAFQLNPGNHFKNTPQRTAAGIAWCLTASKRIVPDTDRNFFENS